MALIVNLIGSGLEAGYTRHIFLCRLFNKFYEARCGLNGRKFVLESNVVCAGKRVRFIKGAFLVDLW